MAASLPSLSSIPHFPLIFRLSTFSGLIQFMLTSIRRLHKVHIAKRFYFVGNARQDKTSSVCTFWYEPNMCQSEMSRCFGSRPCHGVYFSVSAVVPLLCKQDKLSQKLTVAEEFLSLLIAILGEFTLVFAWVSSTQSIKCYFLQCNSDKSFPKPTFTQWFWRPPANPQ